MSLRKIHTYALNSGAGTQTLLSPLNPYDLTRALALHVRGSITKAATADAGTDVLDVRLQSTSDRGATWDTRARLQFDGSTSPAAGTPETKDATIQPVGTLADTEESGEPSGSLGATDLAAGAVRNGPFPNRYRDPAAAAPGELPVFTAWRLRIDVTDANNNADFEGTLEVSIDSPDF